MNELIDPVYEQDCALNNEPPQTYEVIVKHNNQLDRAHYLGFTHTNGLFLLVEYYLPVNGKKIAWAKNGQDNICIASFQQLHWNETIGCKTGIKIEYLKANNFRIPPNTLIDMFGYAYLSNEQQEEFWFKFRNNKEKM